MSSRAEEDRSEIYTGELPAQLIDPPGIDIWRAFELPWEPVEKATGMSDHELISKYLLMIRASKDP